MVKLDGDLLMYYCKRGGATYQKDVYKVLGISQVPFQRRLAGEISFTVEEVQTLARTYHISLEELNKVFKLTEV